jgi:uncharacterized protein YjdB
MTASAQVEINGIYYSLSSNGATVVHHGYCHYSGSIVIPSTVTYNNTIYKVTAIASKAFIMDGITSVSIGSNVKTIGDCAFQYCDELTSVTIGSRVQNIGSSAFEQCTSITSVKIPSSVTTIGECAFVHCKALKSVTIGKNVKSIGRGAFSNCSALKSVTIPDSVTTIGEIAFSGCSSLTSVTIGNGVTYINSYFLSGCSSLTSVTIGNGVTAVGERAFSGCSALKSVNIPDGVETIGKEAFSGCSSLTSITIPNSVISIGENAFYNCKGLKSVTIGNGLKTSDNGAFSSCSSLNAVHISDLKAWCKIAFTYAAANPLFYAHHLFMDDKEIKDLVIPNSVTSIDQYTFIGCSEIQTLTIGSGVREFGDHAFYDMTKLTSITSLITNPLPIDNKDLFYNTWSVELVVPAGTKEKYQATAGWNDFDTILEGISLNKTEAIIKKGKAVSLEATVYPSRLLDKSVKWKSSNTKVATVTDGWVRGIKAGKATITCTSNATGLKTTCEVLVGYVKLDKTKAILEKSKTMTLKATVYPSSLTDKSVKWKSSNTAVATVTSSGKVKGVKAGTATITCTSNATGLKATCKVTVGYVKLDQNEAILQKTKTMTLTPKVYPSSLEDKSVTWESSNTKVATVTSEGEITGVKAGFATIRCISNATGLKDSCKVTVGYVKLDQTEITVEKGKTVTLKATVYPSALEDKSVTWSSSNTAVATVTSKGKVKGIKAGKATITCTSNATGLKTTCKVTVTATATSRSLDGDDDDELTGIEEVNGRLTEDPASVEPFDVYDLSGRKVLNQVTSLDGLPNGIYIVNGRKVVIK